MGQSTGPQDPELLERLAELGWPGPGSPTPPLTRLAAYGVISRDERVLLCRVAAGYLGAGRWTLPGGGLEFGEAPEAAAVRELEEETGLVARVSGSPEVSSETGTWPIGSESVRYPPGSLRLPDGARRRHRAVRGRRLHRCLQLTGFAFFGGAGIVSDAPELAPVAPTV